MSDTVPAPAFLDDGEIAGRPTKAIAHKEAAFQEVAVQFIRKIVLPPMFVAATVNENEMTDNARSRAKKRGMVSGLFDLYIAQAPHISMWQELKWGKNTLSENQLIVAVALDLCGIPRGAAWSIHNVLSNLREAKFTLNPAAPVLAVEYQARAETAVREAELKAAAKNSGASPVLYKQRSRAPTPSRTRRWAKIQQGMR